MPRSSGRPTASPSEAGEVTVTGGLRARLRPAVPVARRVAGEPAPPTGPGR
ncbi:MAG TPA: hypothetical protein VGB14_20970 [Acidimicrobiales bacterium]